MPGSELRRASLAVSLLVACAGTPAAPPAAEAAPPPPPAPGAEGRVAQPDEPAPRDRDHPWMSLETWRARHHALLQIPAPVKQKAQVVLVGDSIVEGWDEASFREFFGRYAALKLAIGGDKTQEVLWRIEQGELDGLSPRALVLLIGTNNLGAWPPDAVARGVARVVAEVRRKLPNTVVVVLGVLPREERADAPLRAEVSALNARLAGLEGEGVRYLDVGARLLADDGAISREIMADYLHPTPRGYRLLAEALAPLLAELTAGSR